MRIGSRLGQTGWHRAAALPMLVAASLVSAAVPLNWVRAETQDKSFSVETPCDLELVALLARAPERIGELETRRESRVLCVLDGQKAVFTALQVRVPTKKGDPTLFEMIAERVAKNPEGDKMKATTIDGRRAVTNREFEGGNVAQTALVDLGPDGLIILNVGVMKGSAFSAEEALSLIDTFTNSLKVNAK